MLRNKPIQIEGMFILIESGNVEGLKHCGDELEKRGIPAVIIINEEMIDKNCNVVKNLAARGFEIAGTYDKEPFWSKPYDFQYEKVSQIKDRVQSCIDEPMRVFASKYFAYDETTLKVADKLGIEYVLARGTAGAKAVIYKADEYNVRIISVSNVPSKEIGTGSLCDFSLWSRGETPDGFRKILFSLKEDKIILVSHTHLGGAKLRWWNVYQDFLNENIVTWQSLDKFAANPIALPNAQIPLNTEVKYRMPKPNIPLEQEPSLFT